MKIDNEMHTLGLIYQVKYTNICAKSFFNIHYETRFPVKKRKEVMIMSPIVAQYFTH